MKPKDQMGSVAGIGLDVHYEFSTVTMRDSKEKVVCRERLEHRDREALRRRLAQWPPGAVTAMEGSFGWGWLSDELLAAGLDAHLSSCFKVEQLRQARDGEQKAGVGRHQPHPRCGGEGGPHLKFVGQPPRGE